LSPTKSPKSCAFPVVAVVIKDMTLPRFGDPPSAMTILVELFATPNACPTTRESPKSVAFPVVEIVTN